MHFFQRAVFQFLVVNIDKIDEFTKLKNYFKTIDTAGTGEIQREKLKTEMKKISSYHLSDEEFDKLFDKMDRNKDNSINYTEFLVSAIDLHIYKKEEYLKMAFDFFDNVL